MKQRVAKKMLKYRETLNYTERQLQRAEETLKEMEDRRAKREGLIEAQVQEPPE